MTTTSTPDLLGSLQGTWDIDPAHSEVSFVVRHLMVSNVRGQFNDFSGSITIGDPLSTSRVEAQIALASIDTNNAERDAHLRSPDFLDVERFPTMTYRSTSVRAAGDHYLVDGELTLHGVTRPVALTVEYNGYLPASPFGDTRVGFSARAEIDRRDFGLTWNGPVEGGGVIVGHTVQIQLEVEAVKRPNA